MQIGTVNEKPVVYDVWDNVLSSITAQGHSIPAVFREGIVASYMSCGVSILYGIWGQLPRNIVHKVLNERHSSDLRKTREAFVMFSDTDNDSNGGGNALYKYILDHNLGPIVEFGPRKNPNSGNMIKLWVWTPPHASLEPTEKWLPVQGKRLVENVYGHLAVYVGPDDPRFHENRTGVGREA
jgi:hypothetical protein